MNIVILFLATIVAFWLSAVAGGGASLILIPILNSMLPPMMVPVSLTIGTFTSNASRIAVFRKNINWKIFAWFVPFSIPAVILGAWIIKYANPTYLEFLISFFLIANLSQLFKKKKDVGDNLPKTKHLHGKLAVIGFLAGFISGLTGAVGLLFNRFYLKFGLKKEEIIATRAANEIFLHLIKLITYFSLGLFSTSAVSMGITIAIASLVSSITIKYILPYISEHIFRNIGYTAMVISGFVLMFSSIKNIQKENKLVVETELVDGKPLKSFSWREHNFSIEFSHQNGIMIEQPVSVVDLPLHLQEKFHSYSNEFDKVNLEKIIRLGKEPLYEFSCYVGNRVAKLEMHQ
ncbi:MAG: sulfite exporter TauE/SafE family protein [Pseudopedobacter saltans]|uniref:Probable membrane transporter protein n=1 Tax=Pseudopedobacter saltans TaxID=151895 RepID=A0A2W5EY31_9SPHI|nr:MAG: sulfite exporter TauE/SafE family protein [Pseudopedobacter saltans]